MPRQISGHFHAPFAYARALWTAVSKNLVAVHELVCRLTFGE